MGTRSPKPLQFIGQFLSRKKISQGNQGKQRHNEHLKLHIYYIKGIIMLKHDVRNFASINFRWEMWTATNNVEVIFNIPYFIKLPHISTMTYHQPFFFRLFFPFFFLAVFPFFLFLFFSLTSASNSCKNSKVCTLPVLPW